jgi:hypothetical protein
MRLSYLIAASFIIASFLTLWWSVREQPEFDEAVTRAVLMEEIRRDDRRCPLNDEAIDRAKPWVLAACAQGGLGWYVAAERYRDDAEKVYLVYGQDPGLADIFQRLGPPVVPVIAYFVRNGSTQYLLQDAIGGGLARLWGEGDNGTGVTELSPEQYGLIAIEELRDRGHEMLSEFEVVNGQAVRKQFTRTFLAAKHVIFDGISDLEKVIVRGERLPTWSEVGWASFDAVMVAGGVGVAAKALRAARAPVTIASRGTAARLALLGSAGRGALQSLATVCKAAGVAAVVAIPYIAMTRPYLLTSAAGWVAEQAGLPGWLGVFAMCLALCVILALAPRILLAPMIWALRVLSQFGSWIASDRRTLTAAGLAISSERPAS